VRCGARRNWSGLGRGSPLRRVFTAPIMKLAGSKHLVALTGTYDDRTNQIINELFNRRQVVKIDLNIFEDLPANKIDKIVTYVHDKDVNILNANRIAKIRELVKENIRAGVGTIVICDQVNRYINDLG